MEALPEVMVIAEAPGREEAAQGRPLIGRSGQFLRKCMDEAGLRNVYLTNRMKHRPPDNRDPTDSELTACFPYLEREIEFLRPKVIILVGRFAARLAFQGAITKVHGRWSTYKDIPCVAMYHPAFVLRSGSKPLLEERTTSVVSIFRQVKQLVDADGAPQERVPFTRLFTTAELPVASYTVDCEASGIDPRTVDMRLFAARRKDDNSILIGEPGVRFAAGSRLRVHNALYDATLLSRYGVGLYDHEWDDTRVIAHVARMPDTSMKGLASRLLGKPVPNYEERFGDPLRIWDVPFADLASYCGEDTVDTDLIWDHQKATLPAWVWSVYEEIERPLIPVVSEMTVAGGFALDHTGLDEMQKRLTRELMAYAYSFRTLTDSDRKECWQCQGSGRVAGARAGRTKKCPLCNSLGWTTVNLRSDQQVADVLFNKLGLPIVERTDGGAPAVGATTLAKLAHLHPAVKVLQKLRGRQKLLETYVLKYLQMERLRSLWQQTGTETGRFSSRDENLQNVPPILRQYLLPPEGCDFVSADYTQIEYRTAAHMSQDPEMLAAYRSGKDMHDLVASKFSIPRKLAKIYNFGGLLYGGTAQTIVDAGLRQGYPIDPKEAAGFLAEAREEFPKYYRWFDGQRQIALSSGWMEGLYGRQFSIPGWDTARSRHDKAEVGRRAVNFPVQGGAADIVKRAMRRARALGYPIAAQVHDEITVPVPQGETEEYRREFVRVLTEENPLSVPITVEDRVSSVWKEYHPS